MDYFQLQQTVFNHLWNKHQQDNGFTFSVRQKASKGAERNHFIGTSKSTYFGFTCWDIPVYFPGSSADLTNFIFTVRERCFLRFQYGGMVKTQTDPQSQGDLALGYTLSDNLRAAGLPVSSYDDKNKILYYYVELDPKGYGSVEEILKAFEELYALVAPVVDKSIDAVKSSHTDWQAGRYTKVRFENLVQKMHTRLEKFASGTPLLPAEIEEEAEVDKFSSFETKQTHPLNTILYGPPGTGKTYHTVNKAVAIANPHFVMEGKSRKEIKEEYNRLVDEKQIQFVTFHQSMSYEDFIEGIKPVEPKPDHTYLKYEIRDGIFKRMVENALYQQAEQEASLYLSEDDFGKAIFYSLGLNTAMPGDKDIYNYCLQQSCIALNVAEGYDATGKAEAQIKTEARSFPGGEGAALARLVHHLKVGNYVLLCDGDSTCRAIGQVVGEYQFKPNDDITPDHFRAVTWLVKDVSIPREQLYASPFSYGLERLDRNEVKKDYFTKSTVPVKPATARKNYVLIIDEINRGNVSQIFGELITLIEEDKRLHRSEVLTVTLPYSQKPFSVPDNLYLIGTMNTADRSVEALDTALRRRFQFEPMMPKPDLLSPAAMLARIMNTAVWEDNDWDDEPWRKLADPLYELLGVDRSIEEQLESIEEKYENEDGEWQPYHLAELDYSAFNGINLQTMLEAINRRLEVLLSKDHAIGHAWLMDVYNLADLRNAFRNKILPLLQEYFYNSGEKIGLVLGERFFVKKEECPKVTFATFPGGEDIAADYVDKVVYRLKKAEDLQLDDFKSIYS